MNSYRIALNFEDGVTRFVDCGEHEKVLDAAYRHQINLPMDCSDGVCGTCKCQAESGQYEQGDDYIEDALTQEEADKGLVLTCQMIPKSDCVIAVPISSGVCKTAVAKWQGQVSECRQYEDAAYELKIDAADDALPFLAGQYVNITVPGGQAHRSYSFSSAPGEPRLSFLIKQVPGGLMSSWLAAQPLGQQVEMTGPLGSFYLRQVTRPLLFLAGGTGLAPFLSMLEVLVRQGCTQPVHLVYGVTRDQDLVMLAELDSYTQRLPGFSYTTCVVDPESHHERKGYVTQHLDLAHWYEGQVDVYLCGPPPMVDAVSQFIDAQAHAPANFYYEKFITSQ